MQGNAMEHHAAFELLRTTWTQLGVNQAYWSVLTAEPYRPQNLSAESLQTFFKSGEHDAAALEQLLQSFGATLRGKAVLDFGCGVGRMLKGLQRLGPRLVMGCDVSDTHLAIARRMVPAAHLHLMDKPAALPTLEAAPDVVYSFLVLQHNRPPLIRHYVAQLLALLAPGGYAVLHIPFEIPNYQPQPNANPGEIEMHCLPKAEVYALAEAAGCKLLGEDPTDRCGGGVGNVTYIFAR
jgi:SAM-dependent methyltransferase